MSKPRVLRFGIQSLDKLIGSSDAYRPDIPTTEVDYGIQLSDRDDGSDDSPLTSSICLTGPDGTGKSVFALHMTSHYLADCLPPVSTEPCEGCPKVLYISTDLTYNMALKAWNNFGLDRPFERREPLIELKEGRRSLDSPQSKIELKQYFPAADSTAKSIVNYLEGHAYGHSADPPDSAEVCFVDLASRTAGDDWGFVHRLLSNLEKFEKKDEPRHLVVLDAVEGFETLAGDVNAFGEKSTRRSRIAQVMRLVTGKCHVVFVVEEGRDERLPEEFVTDVVIRLRNVGTPRYLRRTVEVEKARGQFHIRGQHPFAIRDGKGSTTGTQANADEPEVKATGLFDARDFIDAPGLIDELNDAKTPLTTYLLERFAPGSRELLEEYKSSEQAKGRSHRLIPTLVDELNQLLKDPSLFEKGRLIGDPSSEGTNEPYKDNPPEVGDLIRLNRALLEEAFGKRLAKSQYHQSYVHIFPSLNYLSREIMIDRYNPRGKPPEGKFAAFGIQYLDNMLDGRGEKAERKEPAVASSEEGRQSGEEDRAWEYDTRGLPCGTTTALIGDSLTQKSQLGRAFLSRAFYGYALRLARAIGKAELPTDYPVTLMFTTQAVSNEILYSEFQSWFEDRDDIDQALGAADDINPNRRIFEHELKKWILCRRFEIHDIPGPILMHIFQRNIEKAQRLMFKLKDSQPLPHQSERFQESWRIRVVIDDLNSFRNLFPEMREDPLMLPSLLSMLSSEGVTALIIDTQTSGSPELSITERFDSSVRELVKHRIYTWRLPFYGENRVAIGLIPPISHEYRGIIRELRWETRGDSTPNRSLMVDPHFELYMGLEKGQPQPVPLEIRLYAETPNFKKYIEAEEKFFREVFTPVFSPANQDVPHVISCADVTQYDSLRDSSRLQRDTRLDHTTILHVDEFWWLRRAAMRRAGAFRPQGNYLSSVTCTRYTDHLEQDRVADHFGVFQPPRLPDRVPSQGIQPESSGPPERLERRSFFDPKCGYHLDENDAGDPERAQLIDRVPFTWDFGFLLCNETAWEEAFDQEVRIESGGSQLSLWEPEPRRIRVGEVWNRLFKANEDLPKTTPPVSWREFLAASKIVAEHQSYRTSRPAVAFDFTMLSPESFSCLILEMWVSEIYISLSEGALKWGRKQVDESAQRSNPSLPEEAHSNDMTSPRNQRNHLETVKKRILERLRHRRWDWELSDTDKLIPRTLLAALKNDKGKSLATILDERSGGPLIHGYSLELYKVFLLLIETMNFAELVDTSSHLNFEFKSRDVSPLAVSARHWYRTASKFTDSLTPEQIELNWVPVRLPGHFSVRSDWFLAVAGGSRSNRLADHALDLLSSQRANVTRLQEGIGLPTRKLFDKDEKKVQLRTRLVSFPKKGAPLANVQYEKLREIGAQPDSDQEFFWLWRSGIWAYNRHSRIWHKWLNRTLLKWHSWRQRFGSKWTSGFEVYDLLSRIEFEGEGVRKLDELSLGSWNEFHKLRDILISELEQVSTSEGDVRVV